MANQFGIDVGAVQDRRRQRVVDAQRNKLFDLQVRGAERQEQTAQQRNTLFGKFGQASTIEERQDIAKQTYSVDPQAALKMEESIAQMSDQQRAQTEQVTNAVARGAASILSLPPEQFDQAYAEGLTQFSQRFGEKAKTFLQSAPLMNAPPEEKRAWLQRAADEALTTKEILERQKTPKQSFGQPIEVLIDGKPTLVQFDKNGNQRVVEGVSPKKGKKSESGPDFETEQKLRKEFDAKNKDFVKVRDAYGRIIASASDPSAAGDLALIFNYMKVLDPGSTVREGEFATAQNSASIPARVRAQWNSVRRGERLSDETRQDFVARAQKLYTQQESFYKENVNQYTALAETYGFDPQNIITDATAGFIQDQQETQPAEAAPARGEAQAQQPLDPTTISVGEVIQDKNGKWIKVSANPDVWEPVK
ncbi:MAG: hypothetical protein NXI13_16440 [Proteobacteria bacterium]|nr:hypothetical protein [Pseudomonadota bacterium]